MRDVIDVWECPECLEREIADFTCDCEPSGPEAQPRRYVAVDTLWPQVSASRMYELREAEWDARVALPEAQERFRRAEAKCDRLREAQAATVSRLARILRLTYHEDMPDHLADLIRSLCAVTDAKSEDQT